MLVLAAIGGGAFFLASTIVSIRLLLLARRTRALPELLIGSGLLVLGAIGYPLAIAVDATGRPARAPRPRSACSACPAPDARRGRHRSVHVARVPTRRRLGAWARDRLLRWTRGARGVADPPAPAGRPSPRTRPGPGSTSPSSRSSRSGWAGAEAMLYHRKLVRRLVLGLGRRRLHQSRGALVDFSISVPAFAISALVLALRATGHELDPRAMGIVLPGRPRLPRAACGSAFLPPHRYLRWIEAQSHRTGA